MQNHLTLSINNLTYSHNELEPLFQGINLSFGLQKTGLIGRNGIGKSSLFKLFVGELKPDSGSIDCRLRLAYCPQIPALDEQASVGDALGISSKLKALHNIMQGSVDEQDYVILNDEWDIEQRSQQLLTKLDLNSLTLETPFSQLSGGEKTRLLLVNTLLQTADLVLLDEPTNNLDQTARKNLYKLINESDKGFIIISHDRTLLNQMDSIIELNSNGADIYGGNYDYYAEQKQIHQQAAQKSLLTRIDQMEKSKKTIQTRLERHQQSEAKGKRDLKSQVVAKGQIDKMAKKAAMDRSARTKKRILNQADRKLDSIQKDLSNAKDKLDIYRKLDIDLQKTSVPNSKTLFIAEELSFAYSERMLIKQFNFEFKGPERIAISGDNGSGKSTLIQLLLGKLIPTSGTIQLKTERVAYLDQHASQLINGKSIVENFQIFNPDIQATEAYRALAHFLFRNKAAEQLVDTLSGGERLRALLACVLMAKQPPELLILDEPTNHLDLESLKNIEDTLNQYQGGLLVVSHDPYFLEKIHINKRITLPIGLA